MQRKSFAVDYRQFRLSKLNDESFRHLKLLLFWPIYGFFFYFVEKLYMPARYYPMHCALDDMIPFCELFMIPYLAWFLCIVGMLLYTMLYDIGAFKRFMYFIILTYSVTIVIYLIFPTCQQLRPAAFPRDNLLTQMVGNFYAFDTNTNVCPSIHVLGALGVMFAGWDAERLRKPLWRAVFAATALLICLSTVFLKQHAVIDVLAALPLALIAYAVCYRPHRRHARRETRPAAAGAVGSPFKHTRK